MMVYLGQELASGIFNNCSDLEFNGHFWIATGSGTNQLAVSGDLGETWTVLVQACLMIMEQV